MIQIVQHFFTFSIFKAKTDTREGSNSCHFLGLLFTHRVGGNRKHYKQLMNTDQKLIETGFLIAICGQCGDKWQLKSLFLTIFYLRSLIVLAFLIAAYPVWFTPIVLVLKMSS